MWPATWQKLSFLTQLTQMIKDYKPRSARAKFNNTVDDDIVLFKRLIKSIVGIILVLVITLGGLQFFGPKIFSIFGYLSLERFKKVEVTKSQTPKPSFVDTSTSTKNKKISLSGYAEGNSQVKIFVNGPEAGSTKADNDGKFTFSDLELLDGQNIIFVKATSEGKDESEKSDTLFVSLDTKKPEISIEKPANDQEIQSVDSRTQVSGKVNEEATVKVNSNLTVVDTEGRFETLISLKSGENRIIITAIDKAGNEATSSVKVNFKKR